MFTRRRFLAAAGTIAGFHIVPRGLVAGADQPPPSERLNIAGIGVAGQGAGVLRRLAELGQNIVALCDVDSQRAAGTFRAYPQAEVFQDYRVLLDRCQNIDAVMIATPDHTHAPVTLAALRAKVCV